MKIVYDVDGTLFWSIFQFVEPNMASFVQFNPYINPRDVEYVCTGRSYVYEDETRELLARFGVFPKELIMNQVDKSVHEYNHGRNVVFKVEALNNLDANIYVDDDTALAVCIKKLWDGHVLASDELCCFMVNKTIYKRPFQIKPELRIIA